MRVTDGWAPEGYGCDCDDCGCGWLTETDWPSGEASDGSDCGSSDGCVGCDGSVGCGAGCGDGSDWVQAMDVSPDAKQLHS